MHGDRSKRSRAFWARGFAAFWAMFPAAAGGGALAAPVETVLHSFTFGDGADPEAGVIADSNGNVYGTTFAGGASDAGVVFKLSPGGTYTVLHSFSRGSDGRFPLAGLVADSSGNLYGTTDEGGGSGCGGVGCGVVFKLSPDGTETVLHPFTGGSDGANPLAGLIADSSGNLYGTTAFGGASGNGVVFKLSPSGTETVLHAFSGFPSDGGTPEGGLIADSSGNLYGTTAIGGASGNGVVFKLSASGTETVLYSFKGGSDGGTPVAGLIADSGGNLYGTTFAGGASNSGVVFKLSPSGTETVLHSFSAAPSDGTNPRSGLIADSSGNLFGTTQEGGALGGVCPSGCGMVFKVTPSGTETVLYAFTGGSDGANPLAGLIADSIGNLYGTASRGGGSGCPSTGCGTVFKLTGAGFVPTVQFAAFSPKVMINFGATPNTDAFEIQSNFTLGSASNGINPLAQPVTFQVGALTTTIPPGSFTGTVTSSAFGPFTFAGTINGVSLHAAIAPTGAKRFLFQAGAQDASLTGTANPVPVTLTIGNNSGATSVTAAIAGGLAAAH
ncbi:MAG: choice-of-anchor tandem repeat GloVer-containing protein [Methylocella sp.]